jgi:hypothetical protein
MNKIKLSVTLIVATAFIAVLGVHAQSNKELQPKKVKQKAASVQLKDKADPKQVTSAVSEPKTAPMNTLMMPIHTGSKQGYLMVTDVLDGFGGESESENYKIPVNSGGQPSAIGISESANWGVEAGYVLAIRVTRGDVNADGIINVGDVVSLVNYLYKGGGEPCPVEAGDVTSDGIVNVGDVVYLVNYLYKGGDPPAC